MRRLLGAAAALFFIAGFALLTYAGISAQGLNLPGVVSLVVLVLLGVGIIGALKDPRR